MTRLTLVSSGLVILLGSYLAWAGGAFAIVYQDQTKRDSGEGWGLVQWGAIAAIGGGLVLPFYFSSTRGPSQGILPGIGFGIAVAVLALGVRIGLSAFFRVPVL